jgi:polyhydroxybutyrate depolymerase
VEAWAERNNCRSEPEILEENEHVLRENWGECNGGAEVALITLKGGGHTWPRISSQPLPNVFPYLDATNTIWDFFSTHPKAGKPGDVEA